MALQIERIPTFGDNYTYLLICDETNEAAVVDAPEGGAAATAVAELLGAAPDAPRPVFDAQPEVAGLALFALSDAALERLRSALSEDDARVGYRAAVRGPPEEWSGAPLGEMP